MKSAEIAMTLGGLRKTIEQAADGLLETQYTPSSNDSNLETSVKAELHKHMAQYITINSIDSWASKRKSELREIIESTCLSAGIDSEPSPGQTKVIHSDHDFVITKKQNNDGEKVDMRDFYIELQKLGVSAETISEAKIKATKSRKGAVYLQVMGNAG